MKSDWVVGVMLFTTKFNCRRSLTFAVWFQIADLANEDTPQLYTMCGRGPRSTLRVLRHGLEVNIHNNYLTDTNKYAHILNIVNLLVMKRLHYNKQNRYLGSDFPDFEMNLKEGRQKS